MTSRQPTASALQAALQQYQQGDFQAAERLCRKVLEIRPNDSDALHLLGIIAFQSGKGDVAIDLISRAITIRPDIFDYHNNLGLVLRAQGKPPAAEAHFRKAVQLKPESALAHNNLGLALRDQGRLKEAVSCYREALRWNPLYAAAHSNLGVALQDSGDLDDAIACFREALRVQPGFAEALNNLGYALQRLGKMEDSILAYREAIRQKPGFAEAHNNLGNALQELGRTEEAVSSYREALRWKPEYAKAHINLGNAFREQGRADEAREQFGRALALMPESLMARWGRCIAEIPCLYQTEEEIDVYRARYERALRELKEAVSLDSPASIASAAEAVGSTQPFYLAFQGRNDRELQHLYGAMVSEIQSACYPRWAKTPMLEPLGSGQPIKVGIVSAFFHHHSNWKVPIRGWIENLDRSRFSLYGYYTGKKKDDATELARKAFTRFVEDSPSFEGLCEEIEADHPHVLIYPEIGMDPTTVRLAALRLAPVQCTSWGHPDTSGLPTVDYFLSSDLMEPPDAEEHYTERLVRLPNLSIYYTPPELPVEPLVRAALGIRERTVAYSCVHSLLTYLPQFDDLFVRIACEVEDCQFVFLAFSKSTEVTDRFRSRLGRAFIRAGLRSEDYVVFLPHLDQAHFQAVQRCADVLLDSISWSACNTTLEAISWDLPVVTLPGNLMRGRHSYAIFKMMGVPETIAATQDDYVRLAIRLGKEADFRRELAARIRENKHRIYRDMACIRGLERFLEQAVERHGLRC